MYLVQLLATFLPSVLNKRLDFPFDVYYFYYCLLYGQSVDSFYGIVDFFCVDCGFGVKRNHNRIKLLFNKDSKIIIEKSLCI